MVTMRQNILEIYQRLILTVAHHMCMYVTFIYTVLQFAAFAFVIEFQLQLITYQVHVCLTGGNGYINDYPAGRLLRDAKLIEIGAGTSEIRRLIIGRTINSHYR